MTTPSHWRNIEDFLSPGTCFADAMDAAIASYPGNRSGASWPGPVIWLTNGTYTQTRPLELKRQVSVIGPGRGQSNIPGRCLILVEPNIGPAAITINSELSRGDGLEEATTTASGSILEGFEIRRNKGSIDEGDFGHGIRLRTRATLRDIAIWKFAEDGLSIIATGASADPAQVGNANLTRIDGLMCRDNGRHGVYVQGGDANSINAYDVNVIGNRGWGILDDGFLGNRWIGLHAANNGSAVSHGGRLYLLDGAVAGNGPSIGEEPGISPRWIDVGAGGPGSKHWAWSPTRTYWPGGPYCAVNDSARSVFVGMYAEEGQRPSRVGFNSLGIENIGETTHDSNIITGQAGGPTILPAAQISSGDVQQRLGSDSTSIFTRYFSPGGEYRERYNPGNGNHEWGFGGATSEVAMSFSTNQTVSKFGRPNAIQRGLPMFPRGILVGKEAKGRAISFGDAPPAGDAGHGDLCFNCGTSGPMLWRYENGVWVEKDLNAALDRIAAIETQLEDLAGAAPPA